jgi:hypothetical protein
MRYYCNLSSREIYGIILVRNLWCNNGNKTPIEKETPQNYGIKCIER